MAILNITTQPHVRQVGIPKPQFNVGRFFSRLNGTEDVDPVAQQRQNRAADGRISGGAALDQTQAAR